MQAAGGTLAQGPAEGTVTATMAADTPADPRRQLAVVLLAVLFIVVQFPVVMATFTPKSVAVFDFQVLAFPSDLLLVVLIVLALPDVVGRLRDRSLGLPTILLAVLIGWMLVALAVHPHLRGVQTLFRLTGTLAIATLLSGIRKDEELGVAGGAFAVWAVLQAILAALQRIRGKAIGLRRLNEAPFPFARFGPALAPQGTMVHPYLLAGLALLGGSLLAWVVVTRRHPAWAVAAALAIAPVAFTYSRAGLLGYALIIGCVGLAALRRGRRHWLAVGALVVGFAVPGVIWINGWTQRAQQTTQGSTISAVDTDRSVLIRQALHLIRHDPVFGVGPGRYVTQLRDRHMAKVAGVYKPVHDVPLLVAAEAGLPAGALAVALLVALAWRARRAGLLGAAVLLGYLPFVLLDHFAYSFPQGLVMTGVWIGGIELMAVRAHADSVSPPASTRA